MTQNAIKNRSGIVLWIGEADNRLDALQKAVSSGADLRGADLRGADLEGADLRGAYLEGADLEGAYLGGADLEGAYLGGADLRGADLRGADLEGADLRGAYLGGADLGGADLGGAYLRGAYLGGNKEKPEHIITAIKGRAHRSDGYEFQVFKTEDGGVIRAGCRTMTLAEFRAHVEEHYAGTPKAEETLRILDFLEAQLNGVSW